VNDQLLTIEQAAERYNCTVAAFRHKIRAKQIDPIFVLKDGRSYRIRPELFALPTPANVTPFARAFDEEKLGKIIAENLAGSSAFANTMMAAMMRQFLRDTTVRSA
jgi:hypothetical protein